MIGQILRQRYKILSKLGGGGFSETYLAEDLDIPVHPKPKCAIKQLHPQVIQPEILQRFEKEGAILYRLGQNHDQIPNLFAYFEENGQFYLVQEFIEGWDLSEEIGLGKRWSEAQTLDFLREILGILAFVHQNNVIHRDIKPANLMRRQRDGKLILIDFGIVKEITTAVNLQGPTANTIVMGTPGYMPSEQTIGRPRFSSDIYAVGMTAIQALTGISPEELPTDNNGEAIWRNQANVSDTLAGILTKMVRYHFSYRYAHAMEALQALSGTAATGVTAAVLPPVPLPPSVPPAAISQSRVSGAIAPHPQIAPPQRRWPLLATGGMVAVAIVAGLALALKPTPQQTSTEVSDPVSSPSSPNREEVIPKAVPSPTSPEVRSPQPTPEVVPSPTSPKVRSPQPTPEVVPSPTSPEVRSPQPVPEIDKLRQKPAPKAFSSVPVFPVNTPRKDVEAVLGQPARDLKGAYGNTRAVVYESVQSGVDLGYLFDKNSGRIRQTESSFRQFVNFPTLSQTLDGMVGGQATAEIQQGLQQIYQRQIDYYRFNLGSLKGQIVRQDCDDIYISVWDERLHDFVSFEQTRRC